MVYDKTIEGRYVNLYAVTEEDAEFIVEIRQDEKRNRFLHKVDNDVQKQKEWTKWQREKEGDYYFIAEDKEHNKIGTVAVYEVEGTRGHLGRLLMVGNPFQSMEATMLAVKFAYDILNVEILMGDVIMENKASLNISEAIGMHFNEPVFCEENGQYVKYGYTDRSEFALYENYIRKLIYRD